MATVYWDSDLDRYVVERRGRTISTHRKASPATEAGRRQGKKFGEPVSYKGKRGATKWIYRPDPGEQFSGGHTGTPSSSKKKSTTKRLKSGVKRVGSGAKRFGDFADSFAEEMQDVFDKDGGSQTRSRKRRSKRSDDDDDDNIDDLLDMF